MDHNNGYVEFELKNDASLFSKNDSERFRSVRLYHYKYIVYIIYTKNIEFIILVVFNYYNNMYILCNDLYNSLFSNIFLCRPTYR